MPGSQASPAAVPQNLTAPPSQPLGFWDAVSIIVGIVIGSAIFKAPGAICSVLPGPGAVLALWLAGGVLSLMGALCYSELATTYPRSGGDYVYLSRAWGAPVGFLYGWAHLVGILTGSIGALAYIFAEYAAALWQLDRHSVVWLAVAPVAALTLTNLLGVALGKTAQNLLTLAKVLGLAGVVVAGLLAGSNISAAPAENAASEAAPGLALIFVLYAYGGWSDASFVAAEIHNRRRNIPAALLAGIGAVTAIYLLTNVAYLTGLGFQGVRESSAPAADVAGLAFGPAGSNAVSVLVMISALGGLNGLILTGSRVHASLGADHWIFGWLARWTRRGAPYSSLLAQAAISLALIAAVGTAGGQAAFDRAVALAGGSPISWDRFSGGFERLVSGTAPVFWLFFLLTGLSVFLLRWKDRDIERPFRVPLFPLTPLVFCAMCGYMLWSAIDYAGSLALLALIPLACGVPLYVASWIIGGGRNIRETETASRR